MQITGASVPPSARQRNIRRNLLFIYLYNFLWALGNPMINPSTMITSYFDRIHCEPIVFGLLQLCSSLPVLAQFLPRFWNLGAERPRKPLFLLYELNGLGYVVYGAATLFSRQNPDLFVPLLLALYFLIFCITQLAMILYLNYLSQLFPPEILGRLYGFKGFLQSAGAILGGFFAARLLGCFPFPEGYGWMFLTAGGIFMLATAFLLPTADGGPPAGEPERFSSVRLYARYLRAVSRRPEVRMFTLLMALIYANNSPYGFVLVYLNRVRGIAVDPSLANLIAYGSQAVLILVVGYCMDKVGRPAAISFYMTLVLAANLVILLPFSSGYVFVFAVYGMYSLFISMVKVRIANEAIEPEQQFDVMIYVNVIGVVVGSGLSLLYGALIQATGRYEFIFLASAVSVGGVYWVLRRLRRLGRTV